MKFASTLSVFVCTFALISAGVVQDDAPIVRQKRAAKSGCNVPLSSLGAEAQPLFLKPGTTDFWPISSVGAMDFGSGDAMELFCTSTYKNPSGISGSQTATCVSGVNFKIGKSTYNISEVTCSSWPSFVTRKMDAPCNGGEMYENGFEVGSRFVQQMEVCFNAEEEVSRYVKYPMTPEIEFYQVNSDRPGFIKGGIFGRKNVDKLYTQKSQTTVLDKTLGKGKGEEYINVKNTMFNARGHLAAKTDFPYSTQQRGTFLFSNVAPQWQSFNAGNWKVVEENVRKWVAKKKMNVICYTGIYGVTKLPNEKGVETPIYLDYDKNNNGLMPVPMLYYRVVIEPSTKRGVVLLGVNNPYLTMDQIKKNYIICKDISDKLDFLSWKKDDLKAGYSYACEVNDFAKKTPFLPKFDVKSLLT
ncbi:uncharacterized protein LOC129918788 [Episyrphus balteatus]|uniref:uncharacterized protein LOC129918788 n=1 Tax=Episyrphus balteatus TaxID=286459 RepID=UPI0024851479|nr:uncharacterized protein LOC129918788 [Episyrphus balteatus]